MAMNLAINSDAISNDFLTAVTLGLEWGIDTFELKRVNQKRIPDINRHEINYIKSTKHEKHIEICALSPGVFKSPLTPMDIERESKNLYNTFELAHELSVPKVIVFGFDIDSSKSFAEVKEQIIDLFGTFSHNALSAGIELCIENDRGQWTEDPRNLIEIIKAVNSKSLNVNWDPANMIGLGLGYDFTEHYRILKEHIKHVHVKDGIVSPDGKGIINCMVGDGIVNWVTQFELLLNDGFDGCAVIEPHFGCRITSSRTHIQEAKRLFRIAKSQVSK